MSRGAAAKRVLVLCTGNSCRSQMAAGWINHLLEGKWTARSAGTRPADAVHPMALRAMAEVGIDISGARPVAVDRYLEEPWDLVVTVCDSARETCPVFPRPVAKRHIGFVDPAAATGTEAARMALFRRVRDEIRDRLVSELARPNSAVR